MEIVCKMEPQPPPGIKYMLGAESWLPSSQQSPRRLSCEEWGNLGPMELDPSIQENNAGFRVRLTHIYAPDCATGYTRVGDEYFWTAD
jgi:hypothetical protein